MIPLHPVKSTSIQAVGYHPETQTLAVKYDGAVYHYQNVPPAKWAALQKSESKGKFVAAQIKPHHKAVKQ